MGIEFKSENVEEEKTGERHPERANAHSAKNNNSEPKRKDGILSGIKKVFSHDKPKSRNENPALKEILNKTMSGDKVAEVTPVAKPTPPPVSINILKDKPKEVIANTKDRAATPEEMNKLKDLIAKTAPIATPIPTPPPAPKPAPTPQPKIETPTPAPSTESAPKKIREVPEDVLRKILE